MSTKLQSSTPRATFAPTNLVDMLRQRTEIHPDSIACKYLGDGEDVKGELTFAQLDSQARAVAARLQGLGASGECAILLYPPGLEFFSALFGCLYAGVIAVPLPVPRLKASVAQFLNIVEDVDARILMSTATSLTRINRMDLAVMKTLVSLTTEETPAELARAWRPATIPPDSLAYLQYTSGSTSSRKGVMVTHRNVIDNLLAIAERFDHGADAVCVNWLPHIHDLGLVSGMLQPLYHGHRNILMSPNAFVQQPIRWLDAISEYRGTYTNSPNFGYDLCVRRTTAEQRTTLDLSSWQVALNGAEPVRHQTIEEFSAMFAPCGFRREVMFPAYGLAEATLVVSGGLRKALPISINLDTAELERDRVVPLERQSGARMMVGCGHALEQTTIAIVDPATCQARAESEIGEIWVRGPGVAAGYWRRAEETEETFRGRLLDGDGSTYLRTGDLGFLRGGELFITGRLKDLIIVRGDNHYPQDIEFTIEQSHTAFRPGCGAAFSIDADGAEQLVVAFELERDHLRTVDGGELERVARRAVAEQHDLHLHTLVLLKTGTVPRTSSGKIQRRQCRADFLAETLAIVWRSCTEGAEIGAAEKYGEGTEGAEVGAAEKHGEGTEITKTAENTDKAQAARASREREKPTSASDLCDWLRGYAGECLNSRLMDERRSIAPHVMLDFGNKGVLGLLVPQEHGGVGFGYADTMQVFQQLGAIDQTLTMMAIVHNVLGIGPILHHGDAALKSEWLPALASGRELVAFAITEPAAGSNPQGILSTATPDGSDAWRLHGQKSWSGTAGWASVVNVFAQNLDEGGEARGVSGFAVPRRTPGLRIGPEALTLGMRGMVQNTIYLEGARVTRQQCLGGVGGGMKVAQDAMMQGRLAIGAACVGGMKRCLQLLVRYAERRAISTGRLIDNPVLLERVGSWSAAVAGLDSLVTHVAKRLDRGEEVPVDVYVVCKLAGAEWFWRAADDLVQFLGGRGYIETNIASQLLRDARVTRILEGPSEALGMFLGSRVVNDATELHQFFATLGAAAVANRLAAVAETVHARCLAHSRFGGVPDARRWAYALIGQIATDAVLLAAMPRDANRHYLAWAESRLESSIAKALAQTGTESFRLDAAGLSAIAAECVQSIGDVEQSLAGEDHALDSMLAAGSARNDASVSSHSASISKTIHKISDEALRSDATVVPAMSQTVAPRSPIDAEAIERFIVRWMAKELKIAEASIDAARPVFDYGLDSVTAVMLAATLEEWLHVDLNPEIVYDIPVIRRFAAYAADRQAARVN